MKVKIWTMPIENRLAEGEVIVCGESADIYEAYIKTKDFKEIFDFWTETGDGPMSDHYSDDDVMGWGMLAKDFAEWNGEVLGVAMLQEVEIEL